LWLPQDKIEPLICPANYPRQFTHAAQPNATLHEARDAL